MSSCLILGLTVGSLGLVMLQASGQRHWASSSAVRWIATRTLPLIVAFFLPIVFRHEVLYAAARSGRTTERAAVRSFSKAYLTSGAFKVRAVIYFVIWGLLMFIFNRCRSGRRRPGDRALRLSLQMLAGPGSSLRFG